MKNRMLKTAVPVAAAALMAASSNAQVTLSIQNFSSYAQQGITATLAGQGTVINTADFIGLYEFAVTPEPNSYNISSPFWSVCISPNGNFTDGIYTEASFPAAAPGINPGLWSSPASAPFAGIENADYLFTTLSSSILALTPGSTAAKNQGTALALAMYTALYTSSGYGALTNNGSAVTLTGVGSGAGSIAADLAADLADLPGIKTQYGILANNNTPVNEVTGTGAVLPFGSVLVPQNTGSQDFIVGGGLPQGGQVPEPSTIISAALLVLPFGASTLRILRKKQEVA